MYESVFIFRALIKMKLAIMKRPTIKLTVIGAGALTRGRSIWPFGAFSKLAGSSLSIKSSFSVAFHASQTGDHGLVVDVVVVDRGVYLLIVPGYFACKSKPP